MFVHPGSALRPILPPPFSHSCLTLLPIMLPFQPFLPHHSVDHASLQPIMDPPVRSGTGDSAAFFGNDNALSRRPKVPHGTQRRHLRGFSSPESTATNYPVSKMRRLAHETTSKGHSVSRTRLFAHKTDSEDPFVSRMRLFAHETSLADTPVSRSRRLAHEATSEDPSVSRMRLFAHEATSELSCATGTLRGLYGRSSMPPR